MNRHAIIVTFFLKTGSAEKFKPLILKNAEASVKNEPECFQFHVTQAADNPDKFVLYEVYASANSLNHHTQQSHFKEFMEASKPYVAKQTIEALTVTNPENVKTAG